MTIDPFVLKMQVRKALGVIKDFAGTSAMPTRT